VTTTGGMLNLPNSLAIASDPTNQVPVANAGPDQTVAVGDTVNLTGNATDGDGDFPLLFEWSLSVPSGSQSKLNNATDPNPSFVPDHEGTYTATLVVSDFNSSSIPDSAVITVSGVNLPPPTVVIKAQGIDPDTGNTVQLGTGIPTLVKSPVTLDGSQSKDTFAYLMVFNWSLVEMPLGSVASLGQIDQPTTSLIPDEEGTYTVRLTVEDGFHESFADFSFVAAQPKAAEPAPLPPPQTPSGAQTSAVGGCSLHKDLP
jgi:K319-like protein